MPNVRQYLDPEPSHSTSWLLFQAAFPDFFFHLTLFWWQAPRCSQRSWFMTVCKNRCSRNCVVGTKPYWQFTQPPTLKDLPKSQLCTLEGLQQPHGFQSALQKTTTTNAQICRTLTIKEATSKGRFPGPFSPKPEHVSRLGEGAVSCPHPCLCHNLPLSHTLLSHSGCAEMDMPAPLPFLPV